MSRSAACLLLLVPLAATAADQPAAKPEAPAEAKKEAKKEEKVLPSGTIVHDLRDLLPFSGEKGKDPGHAFSVTEGYFTGYRADDSDGDGYLARADIDRICVRLQKQLRVHYAEVFAEIDGDGDETITNTELVAYLTGKK